MCFCVCVEGGCGGLLQYLTVLISIHKNQAGGITAFLSSGIELLLISGPQVGMV